MDVHVIRCYSVIDPTLHPKGYTVYKVVEKKLDVDAFDEAVQESVTWKRYNEFYKLYLALSSLHASLQRREEFPDFPKPQIFHRFDKEVIKDRMQSAQDLLNFVGQRRYLVESKAFKEFFFDSKLVEQPYLDASILQPTKVGSSSDSYDASVSSCAESSSDSKLMHTVEEARPDDDVDEEDDDDYDDFEDESSYTGDEDFEEYDEGDSELFEMNSDSRSNQAALLDETQSLDSLIGDHCMTQSLYLESDPSPLMKDLHVDDDLATNDLQPPKDLDDDVDEVTMIQEKAENEEGDVQISQKKEGPAKKGLFGRSLFPVQVLWRTGRNLKHLLSASFHGTLPSATKEDSKQCKKRKLIQMLGTKPYIVQAAQFVKEAKLKENSGWFGDAFDFYKSAIATMLNGVQSDTNVECVEFVRSKISRYLSKAEELHRIHLQCHDPYLFMSCNTSKYCSDTFLLRGPPNDLGKFKVIGVLNKVMLVVDESSGDGECYVMKAYLKSAQPLRNQTNIVPSCIPFMLRPIRFYETEAAIYVLLPYISSGTLWNHVAGYRQNSVLSDSTPEVFDDAQNRLTEFRMNEDVGDILKSPDAHEGDCHENVIMSKVGSDVKPPSKGFDDLFGESPQSAHEHLERFYTSQGSPNHRHSGEFPRCSSEGPSNLSDNEYQRILETSTNQCMSFFSINGSDGDITPIVHDNRPPSLVQFSNSPENGTSLGQHLSSDSLNVGQELDEPSQSPVKDFENSNEASKECTRNNPKVFVKQFSLGLSSSCSEIHRKKVQEGQKLRTSSSGYEDLDLPRFCQVQAFTAYDPERMSHIRLPEKIVQLWAAEIVMALSSLHECGIILRDLNPENILIDPRGHVVLTYFCQWSTVQRNINVSAVDNFYCAPELLSLAKVSRACDFWSFGVILFELLTGMSLKFYRPCGISRHTLDFVPDYISVEAQSLLKNLLIYNPSERITSEEIKSHSFFRGYDWNAVPS